MTTEQELPLESVELPLYFVWILKESDQWRTDTRGVHSRLGEAET